MFALWTEAALAQQPLTLQRCLLQAEAASHPARSAAAQLRASEASAVAARRALLTTVALEFDVPSYSRLLAPQFNPVTRRTEYFPLENLQWTGGLTVTQPVLWTNSTIQLSGMLTRRDQEDRSPGGAFYRDFYTNVSLQLRQPLFVVNSQRIALRRAEIEYEEARSEYRRATLDLRYTVTEAFYRTYAAQEQRSIQRDRVRQQEEAFGTAMRKYRSGLIAEVEALQFEVDLAAARNDLLSTEDQFSALSGNLALLIGADSAMTAVLALEDTTFREVQIDLPFAIASAKRTRTDLQRARNSVERSALALEETNSRGSIRGDLSLNVGLSNTSTAFQSLYTDIREARGAVLTISLPVFDWGRQAREEEAAEARLEGARITAEQTERMIEQEIIDLARRVASSARRVELLFRSRVVAEKANDISVSRFEVGTIGAIDLAQSQQRLLQARLSAIEALIDYNLALADLARRTAYDFVRGSEVTTPDR